MKTPPKRLLVPVAVALLAVMGLTAGWLLLRQPPLPEGLIQANGRIEGDHYLVAGKMPGRVAERFDAGEDAGAHANMAKLLGSQAAVAAVEAALQTHGGYGFDRDYDIITLWPMIRLLEIAPINNEMLLNYIGEHVLGLPKSY